MRRRLFPRREARLLAEVAVKHCGVDLFEDNELFRQAAHSGWCERRVVGCSAATESQREPFSVSEIGQTPH